MPKAKAIEASHQKWTALIDKKNFTSTQRALLSATILRQHGNIQCHTEVEKNISSLKQSNTFTVTTGQQIVTALGPWMVLYKIATTIKLARDLAGQFPANHFVPIFWMATEDHAGD